MRSFLKIIPVCVASFGLLSGCTSTAENPAERRHVANAFSMGLSEALKQCDAEMANGSGSLDRVGPQWERAKLKFQPTAMKTMNAQYSGSLGIKHNYVLEMSFIRSNMNRKSRGCHLAAKGEQGALDDAMVKPVLAYYIKQGYGMSVKPLRGSGSSGNFTLFKGQTKINISAVYTYDPNYRDKSNMGVRIRRDIGS